MTTNRGARLGKGSSNVLSTRITTSRNRLSEATHVLLRENSTQQLIAIEISFLSDAARMRPLTIGRNVSFRDRNGRGQKQGEILIIGTSEEVVAEKNKQTNVNLTKSPLEEEDQDGLYQQTQTDRREPVSDVSISSKSVDISSIRSPTSLHRSCLSQDFAFPSPEPALSISEINQSTTSDLLSSTGSNISACETSKQNNAAHTTSSIILERPSISESQPVISTTSRPSNDLSASRTVVRSTTIKRKMATGDALKEIKHLQSLVQSKDEEINQLKKEVKKMKQEAKDDAEISMSIPSDRAVVQWIDYVYESIHKNEIREQLDLDATAEDLGIERESLELCLELSRDDRISAARRIFKYCIDYEAEIGKEHCWQSVDENIVIKICRFVREFFGVSIKLNDEYVRESLANMMRKDSWKCRNPDKLKSKVKKSNSKNSKTSSRQNEELFTGDDDVDHDDEHF